MDFKWRYVTSPHKTKEQAQNLLQNKHKKETNTKNRVFIRDFIYEYAICLWATKKIF